MNSIKFTKWNQLIRIGSFKKTNKNILARTLSQQYSTSARESSVLRDAEVVICGGGISGVSTAYHLAKRGVEDVLLLEQGSLTCGTSWHAAGLVGVIKGSTEQMKLANYAADLYENLEEETGLSTGFKRTGSVFLATVDDRMTQLRRIAGMARSEGIEARLVSPSELQSIVPWISVDDVVGGIYSPNDGVTDPSNTVMSLARGAKIGGVRMAEKTSVKRILTDNGRVTGVETADNQVINCRYFVNAAGMWSRSLGQLSTPAVTVPLQPNQHQYAIFKPKEGVDFNTPYVRDWDHHMYIREWSGGVMLGAFAYEGKPVYRDGKPPSTEFITLQEDWEQFGPQFNSFLMRVPCAEHLEMRQLFDGPESFTPDVNPIIGEAPEIGNYFVISGMHSMGITFGGGLGKYVADWIVDGKPSEYITSMDIKRFTSHHNQIEYLQERSTETEGSLFKLVPPDSQFKSGRKLCCPVLYDRLYNEGAVFGEVMGIERSLYFDSKNGVLASRHNGIWGKPTWFDTVLSEYQQCMKHVGVIDMSATALFEVESSNITGHQLLNKLFTADLPALGCCTGTWMLSHDGQIITDCVVVCPAQNRYMILSPIRQWTVAKWWLSKNIEEEESVIMKDLTPGSKDYKHGCYSILAVVGNKSGNVLKRISGGIAVDLDRDQDQCIQYGNQGHIVTSTLTGNQGFLLLLPQETAEAEYQALMTANQDLGISNVGYYAWQWIQGENRVPSARIDYDCNNSPAEIASLSHPLNFEKDFIGKQALSDFNYAKPTTEVVQFVLDIDVHKDLWPWGSEPIFLNGKTVGRVSSASYSPTLGKVLCFGQTNGTDRNFEGVYEIDVAGQRFEAMLCNGQPNVFPRKMGEKF